MRKILLAILLFCAGCTAQTNENTVKTAKDINELIVKSDEITVEVVEEQVSSIHVEQPEYGDNYAHINCERIGLDKDIYYGDDEVILKKSLGQYTGSHLFGENNVILVAGHNGTHFKTIRNIEIGDRLLVTTNYGDFLYEVFDTKVRLAAEFDETTELDNDEELLIMYTCYPFDSLATDSRFFVYAHLVSATPKDE